MRCTVVLYDNDLIIAPGAVLLNRSDTAFQILNVILIGNHDGYLRIPENLITDPKNRGTGPGTGDLEMPKSMLFQVIRYGLCTGQSAGK